jgi:hypothetical protein
MSNPTVSLSFKAMMKHLLILISLSGFTMASDYPDYPDSYDEVSEKYESFGFDALDRKEQAIYSIWWLEAEVNNGGFHQYFWNSAGDNANVALESLRDIGANETATLLQTAIDIAFEGKFPMPREERQAQLEVDEDSKMDSLGELDSVFYEYNENFYELLDAYTAM